MPGRYAAAKISKQKNNSGQFANASAAHSQCCTIFESQDEYPADRCDGFVGGAIAANLEARGLFGDTRFAVRGETAAEGLARLRANLGRFRLPKPMLDSITEAQIVRFDLRNAAQAKLGEPEILINCAALATFSNHPSLWETNVDGVLALG